MEPKSPFKPPNQIGITPEAGDNPVEVDTSRSFAPKPQSTVSSVVATTAPSGASQDNLVQSSNDVRPESIATAAGPSGTSTSSVDDIQPLHATTVGGMASESVASVVAPQNATPPSSTETAVIDSTGAGVAGRQETKPTRISKKWLLVGVTTVLLGLAGTGAYAYLVYLPNKPENVFAASLSRTSAAADTMSTYLTDQASAGYKSVSMQGTLAVKSSSGSFDATLSGKSDSNNTDMTVKANVVGEKIDVQMRAIDVNSSDTPDLFVNIKGIKSYLEKNDALKKLVDVDSKWVSIDHTIIDTYLARLEESVGSASVATNPTPEQINDVIAKIEKVNKEYLFSDDANKAVLQYKSYVGEEQRGDLTVHHYKANYNKANLSSYLSALEKAINDSKLSAWLDQSENADNEPTSQRLGEMFRDQAKALKVDETLDYYVDKKTQIAQGLTLTNEDKSTFDISQDYTGESKYPFTFKLDDKTDDEATNTELGFVIDTKAKTYDFALKSGIPNTDIDAKLTLTPSNDSIKVVAPSDAVKLADIMDRLGSNNVLGASSDGSTSGPTSSFMNLLQDRKN